MLTISGRSRPISADLGGGALSAPAAVDSVDSARSHSRERSTPLGPLSRGRHSARARCPHGVAACGGRMSAGGSAPPNLHAIEDVTSPPRASPSHPSLASPPPEKQEPKEAYESAEEPEAPPSPPSVGAEIVATVLRLKSEKRPRSIELHGWRMWWQQRSTASINRISGDWYAVSPDGRQYRSMPELRHKFPGAFADGAAAPKPPASQRTPAPCESAQGDAHTRSPMAERAGTSGAGSSASSSQPDPSPIRSPASTSASGGGGAARSQRAEIIPVGTRLEVDWSGKGTDEGGWYPGTVIEHATELGRRAHPGVPARRRRAHV